ncbi:MAG: hypothetical protein GXO81_02725 [Chlorobi bacterium]|nr:hypothetical protein [Chlorobiota bacterium]
MKLLVFLIFLLIINSTIAQTGLIGDFWFNKDIGNPKIASSAQYDKTNQFYTLKRDGYTIGVERDGFNYLYNEIEGDFILTANFKFIGGGSARHLKTGWMARESEEEGAPHISAVLHSDGLTALQWRESKGALIKGIEDKIFAPKPNYQILQLERKGEEIIMRGAHVGEPLQVIGIKEMGDLPGKVLAGLFIYSNGKNAVEEVRVWNVRIDKPVGNDYNPGKDGWLGCRLETMNVFNGKREVIFKKPSKFEAPNWMPDGKKLLFNMDGALYKIPIKGGVIEKLNTGFADRNNNDHGISFDGKLLAISHSRKGLTGGGSTVYVLPLEGGIPKMVTEDTPSYWHGWAPNNKEVVYVGQRHGEQVYNIYRNSIDGGNEVALTSIKSGEHVDGCEYSPDGRYIYYNGSHSGTMQLWRMKPDGSGKEQITWDEYNDWFPHISPDGQWIVFVSFPADIPVNSHPSYKRVMIRMMPAEGGAPKVIAYMYGGQGTMNVPSWSPDSKHIAFVSNSGK